MASAVTAMVEVGVLEEGQEASGLLVVGVSWKAETKQVISR